MTARKLHVPLTDYGSSNGPAKERFNRFILNDKGHIQKRETGRFFFVFSQLVFSCFGSYLKKRIYH